MARILHIEDDPKNRLLVRKLLAAKGHEVLDAETGLEGIRMATNENPDLVLVDINIPDLDGYEVILRLRGIRALDGVPIVAITAEGDRETSLAVGADGFIGKPIDARAFPKQVRRFLSGHRERSEGSGEAHLRNRSQKIVERLERKVVELSEANRRLEEMARLRKEFLRNVSHELATPMTPVVGYVRLLLAEELGPLSPLQRKTLESVQTSTQRLRAVVDTLLDVSSLDSGRMHFYERDYDFAACVDQAIADAQPLIEEHQITIRRDPPSGDLAARGDPDKLKRAFVHLIDNAVKFGAPGSEVGIGIRSDLSYLELLVADEGPGVASDQLEKVLEPFYQVDGSVTRSHGGVGLGLAYARHVAATLGGGLTIESPPADAVAGRLFGGTLVRLKVAKSPPPLTAAASSAPSH
jgi:signal transduction histidine kinase